MPPSKSPNYDNLDRIMRLLTSYHVFEEYVDENGENPRKYELTAVGKALVKREDGICFGSRVELLQDKVSIDTLQFLQEAVTDGDVEPVVKSQGKSSLEIGISFPRMNKLFNEAMAATSTFFMEDLLASSYKGFEGIGVLVDVGGGIGKALSMIVAKYPGIHGINFDLPHVIEHAPHYPGVRNVKGNMFENVPAGDAIVLKQVLHDWGDEQCVEILKKCYEALSDNGKVIVLDSVLPLKTDESSQCRAALEMDLLMMAYHSGGKERNLNEFKSIGAAAGFKSVQLAHQLDVLISVVQFYKYS